MVTLVSSSLLVFDMAFDVALYGDLSFRVYLHVWAVGLVVVLGALVLPAGTRPITKKGAFVLLLPVLFFPGSVLETRQHVGGLTVLEALLLLVVALAYLVAIPFTLYTLAKILDPDLVELPSKRMRRGLAAIVLVMAVLGYTLASHHPTWLTCRQFDMDGAGRPSN
ncbi:unnamed protein product, partial [Laminaria digitata]